MKRPIPTYDDADLMTIAEGQIDWIAEKLEISREAGRLALLSILMALRDGAGLTEIEQE